MFFDREIRKILLGLIFIVAVLYVSVNLIPVRYSPIWFVACIAIGFLARKFIDWLVDDIMFKGKSN